MGYLKESEVDWKTTSVKDKNLQKCHKHHIADMTHGKMLGGSSGINYLAYTRGDPHDFDRWANIVGDESWNYKNVLPYFIKSENLKDPEILKSPNKIFHGTDGYLDVTRQDFGVTHKYLNAFEQLGHKIVIDTNGNYTLGYNQPSYTLANGQRQSTANSFLKPAKSRANLYIAKNTFATKIIFDKFNNAVGIEVINCDNKIINLKANREVIISAGALHSPKILMLSGIGPKEHLQRMGIDVVSDLPVGENFHEHTPAVLMYATTNSSEMNSADLTIPLIIGYASLNETQIYPDYQTLNLILNSDSLLQFCAFTFSFNNDICQKFYEDSKGREILFVLTSIAPPKSRGRILLKSSNPRDDPLIYPTNLSGEDDLEKAIKCMKDYHRIMYTDLFKDTNAKFLVSPGCVDLAPDTQEFWRCHASCMVTTIYHYAGSCSMGTVVDERLLVRGVHRLRVADGSVMPVITSANTNAPIIMIAEKVSHMIKEDNK
ncbi:LOW QUALITY PROTEIN: ecdysone oxidase-like [Aphomia sociella]